MTPIFKDTRLWKAIDQWRQQDSRADVASTCVLQLLSDSELLLTSGGTSPTDFTLHDARHAFRVAERMVDIIPSDTFESLSPYEKVLLLLAAYCHDIGMVPAMALVRGVHDFLLIGDASNLSPDELEVLKTWLDKCGIGQPAMNATFDLQKLRTVRETAAMYCRFRHNGWSESWIRDNAYLDRLYNSCVEDLVLLCRSHHEGYERLVTSSFDPFQVPGSNQVIHRRYLACVLRIADILDVDPERTPPIVFRHRNIAEKSEIYWWKDQAISVLIHEGITSLAAEPESAVLHKAIEITADDIERELRVCHQVSVEAPFAYNRSAPGFVLPHRWPLQPYLHRRITPHNGAYEYIEGSFRPNSEKVLQLLGSQELYTSPLTAIRELLQNAFDGVRERIALARLNEVDPKCSDLEIGNRFAVSLSLLEEGDDIYLVCQDDGAGMSKDIISNYFLVSGNSDRPDLQVLRRRCQERGIELERTGQFGIGVLSYFLLADHVEVLTRRAAECGDDDGTAWQFITDGVGTFGELRKTTSSRVGTSIRMRLRPSATGDKNEFATNVGNTLRETIIRLPCRFRFNSFDGHEWATNAGWTREGRCPARS